MSFLNKILGSASGNVAEVNSDNEVQSVLSKLTSTVRTFFENDDGTIVAGGSYKSGEITPDYRLRVGLDNVLFDDTFNAILQNTSLWKHTFTTMTMTQAAGFLNVNAAGTSTVSGNSAFLQTYKYFPMIATAPLVLECQFQFTAQPLADEIHLFGFGTAAAAATPLDGAWIEFSSAGLRGITRYNSASQNATTLIAANGMALNTTYKLVMIMSFGSIEYWVDDILRAVVVTNVADGAPCLSASHPLFIQKYNAAAIGSSPNVIFKVKKVSVILADIAQNSPWQKQMSAQGLSNQMINGGTTAVGNPLVQWANTALPTAAAGTNTTAALGAFLTGIFQANAPATSATDIIIASYPVPAGGLSQTQRALMLRKIKIDLVNLGAVAATTDTTYAVALAFGGTQLSLGTVVADTGSFVTASAKMRRIIPLGVLRIPVGSVIGYKDPNPIEMDWDAHIPTNPGEFIQVVAKILVGTATASQVHAFVIGADTYYE